MNAIESRVPAQIGHATKNVHSQKTLAAPGIEPKTPHARSAASIDLAMFTALMNAKAPRLRAQMGQVSDEQQKSCERGPGYDSRCSLFTERSQPSSMAEGTPRHVVLFLLYPPNPYILIILDI